ncbi:MAG TPA: NAD(+) synthase, partial [bacterium]|nr:NAD(+) synthase [bacterium]
MQINIDPLHKVYEKFFHKIFPQGVSDLTEQNIQARIRANLLMAISNNSERLLLNTSNKSELAMGFGTMYGDLCGAIAVISDLTKTQVYELCGHLNLQKEIIPKNILKKAPSAELKPDQKDSDTLPPYDKLDPLLDVLINQYGQGVDFDSCDDLTRKVMNTIMKNEWKRFQAPPTLRISNKAYGAGRRIPVVGKLRI